MTSNSPSSGYATYSSSSSTPNLDSSSLTISSTASLRIITFRFGHGEAMCPCPRHLKHLMSQLFAGREDSNVAFPLSTMVGLGVSFLNSGLGAALEG